MQASIIWIYMQQIYKIGLRLSWGISTELCNYISLIGLRSAVNVKSDLLYSLAELSTHLKLDKKKCYNMNESGYIIIIIDLLGGIYQANRDNENIDTILFNVDCLIKCVPNLSLRTGLKIIIQPVNK